MTAFPKKEDEDDDDDDDDTPGEDWKEFFDRLNEEDYETLNEVKFEPKADVKNVAATMKLINKMTSQDKLELIDLIEYEMELEAKFCRLPFKKIVYPKKIPKEASKDYLERKKLHEGVAK